MKNIMYKNNLGDVIAVADLSGNLVAEYSYDAFGNVLSATGEMAEVNPIRYRGYYYDAESKLYFLKSRYYNPDWRRFLNADSLFIAGDDVINGSNMYSYCYNNPLNYIDSDGMSAASIAQSKRLGEKIMTPIADIFMGYVFPVVTFVMGKIYSGTDEQDREYPFKDYNINNFYFLQLRQYFPKNMSILAGIGAAFLDFHRVNNLTSPNYGNYTTVPDTYQWQKSVGYIWWYDWFFNLGGPIGKKRFDFKQYGTSYVVWCWKGDYWNLGAGAEVGIYYCEALAATFGYHTDPDNLQLKVRMNVKLNDDYITYNFEQTNWWVTSFTPRKQSPNVDLLKVKLNVNFINTGKYNNLLSAFCSEARYQKSQGNWEYPLLIINENDENYPIEINY